MTSGRGGVTGRRSGTNEGVRWCGGDGRGLNAQHEGVEGRTEAGPIGGGAHVDEYENRKPAKMADRWMVGTLGRKDGGSVCDREQGDVLGALSSFMTAPAWMSLKECSGSCVYSAISCRSCASFVLGGGREKCSLSTSDGDRGQEPGREGHGEDETRGYVSEDGGERGRTDGPLASPFDEDAHGFVF